VARTRYPLRRGIAQFTERLHDVIKMQRVHEIPGAVDVSHHSITIDDRSTALLDYRQHALESERTVDGGAAIPEERVSKPKSFVTRLAAASLPGPMPMILAPVASTFSLSRSN